MTPTLRETARLVRRDVVTMASAGKSAHVAPALSCVDILVALFFSAMRVDPARPEMAERDRFILSKGHAAMALYACLARRGYFPLARLDDYLKDGGHMEMHPRPNGLPGVEYGAGSLGHGLALGVGTALALRHRGADARTFVVSGDGECDEGSVYEAAALAGAHRLGHLAMIVDRNGVQACDACRDVSGGTDLSALFSALGWETVRADGHDPDALARILAPARAVESRPLAVLADTVKGKGVPFMENDLEWHYRPPAADDLRRALEELGGA